MSVTDTITLLFASLGAAQCFFFAALLRAEGPRALVANRWLILLLLMIGINLVDDVCSLSGLFKYLPHLMGLQIPASFAIGPALYCYALALTGDSTKKWPLHFFMVVVSPFLAIPFYSLSAQEKVVFLTDASSLEGSFTDLQGQGPLIAAVILIEVTLLIQLAAYTVATWRHLTRHATKAEALYGHDDDVTLAWLRQLAMAISAIYLVYITSEIVGMFWDESGPLYPLIPAVQTIALYVLGYRALRQTAVFIDPTLPQDASEATILEKPSASIQHLESEPPRHEDEGGEETRADEQQRRGAYARSSLTTEEAERILTRLRTLMTRDHIFLDPLLNLPRLASLLGTTPNRLSQVLNQQLGQSFFDCVNSYRVEEVKTRMITDTATPILDIALDVGFNSKSTFNGAFKRFTGMTPSAYRQSQVPESA